MILALNNNLTNFVVREINNTNVKMLGLGSSITTGKNEFIAPVDSFLGNGLQDKNILLKNVTKNLSYGVNLASVASQYLYSIASTLQECLRIVSSARTLSSSKLPVLQKSLNDKIHYINLLIQSANFDGRSLFRGGANIDIQVGSPITDRLSIRITNIDGKLFRSGAINAINNYLGAQLGRVGGYTQETMDEAVISRVNFTQMDEGDLSNEQLAEAIMAVQEGNQFFSHLTNTINADAINDGLRNKYIEALIAHFDVHGPGNNAPDKHLNALVVSRVVMSGLNNMEDIETIAAKVDSICVVGSKNLFIRFGLRGTLQTTSIEDLIEAMDDDPDIRIELTNILADGQEMSLVAPVERALTEDIMLAALSTIRVMQTNIINQKAHVIEVSNALRASHNVIQQASNSYLKTDYVLTAQQLVEAIKHIKGSITMLQAGNNVTKAILKLLEFLT